MIISFRLTMISVMFGHWVKLIHLSLMDTIPVAVWSSLGTSVSLISGGHSVPIWSHEFIDDVTQRPETWKDLFKYLVVSVNHCLNVNPLLCCLRL